MNKKELLNVYGGVSYGIIGAIVGFIVFIIGLADGYQRPKACDE